MSVRRDAGWYLRHDRGGFVRYAEGELDRIDIEVDGLRRLRHEETKARLERLGFDVSSFRPPPPMQSWEQHCSRWPTDAEIVAHGMTREARAGKRDAPAPSPDTLRSGQLLIRPNTGYVIAVR